MDGATEAIITPNKAWAPLHPMIADPHTLSRFISAQAKTSDAAFSELRAGRKRTHWMWFIFPQLKGIGISPTSQFYGLSDIDEATAYIQHPVLGPRLEAALDAVNASGASSLKALFGAPDDLKFCSAMTLFSIAAPDGPYQGALDLWCGGKKDRHTIALLSQIGEMS
jgi:uncharacterized protein (DUF1810 family)